jgi:hypothetical protein
MVRALGLAAAAGGAMLAASFSVQYAHARPSMSRGEQFLNINENVCLQRGRAAFGAAGWVDIASQATWVRGHKDGFASYICCNAAARGGVVVNIFVGYDGSDPAGSLAGAERERLQREMER